MPGLSFQAVECIEDRRGISHIPRLPFAPKNFLYASNFNGEPRGGHAHRSATQVVWCCSGSMRIRARWPDKKISEHQVIMVPSHIVIVWPLTWVTLEEFSDKAAYCVWSSEEYDPTEYIRDYNELVEFCELQRHTRVGI